MIDTPLLTNTEIDIIGEVLNISMGAAATAVSVILNRQVSITTPVVRMIKKDEFEYKNLEPVMGVKINYIKGLNGLNFMIMSIADIRAIVASLLGEETADDKTELDEIHISALGEIMNQMMGSSSTALAEFLHKSIDISPPSILRPEEFLEEIFSNEKNDNIVSVSFKFIVEGLVDNEFITVFPLDFTKEIINTVMNINGSPDDNDESKTSKEYREVVTGHKQIPEINIDDGDTSHRKKENSQTQKQNIKKNTQVSNSRDKMNVSVRNLEFESFNDDDDVANGSNLDLLMDVALNVTVEIGSVKKAVKDVVSLAKGSVIELDKRAGDPVDIIVNGKLFARGDVVVIEDNFGVRITEVINCK